MKFKYKMVSIAGAMCAIVAIGLALPNPHHAVNQKLADEIRQLNPEDFIVMGSGSMLSVIHVDSAETVQVRNILHVAFPGNINSFAAMNPEVTLVRRGSQEYDSCAAAYAFSRIWKPQQNGN